jgi:uncharacterized protein YjbJ (UPF0337 family)
VNRDEIEGKIDELKGEVKKRIGGAADWVEEKKEEVKKKIGDLEEDARRKKKDEDI